MSRYYGLPLSHVERDERTGAPRSFVWRGVTYRVRTVLGTWHLVDRWWGAANSHAARGGTTDRHYYRILCQQLAIFVVYFDAAHYTWVLETVVD